MKMPDGVPNPLNKVCRLIKPIYGLKQSSREWHANLTVILKSKGFIQSKIDYSLYLRKTGDLICVADVYVDDDILISTDHETIYVIKAYLHQEFGTKDLGLLNNFLGIEVSHLSFGIFLSQKKFTHELLSCCYFDLTRKASTPLSLTLKLSADEGALLDNPKTYRSLVRKLNFITTTRHDLAYAVQAISQFMHSPRTSHFSLLKICYSNCLKSCFS